MSPNEFIFEYFRADQDSGAGSYKKMLSCINELEWDPIKLYILDLEYFYFLKTSYWLIISSEVKRRANWRCSCGCRENLEVHHTKEAKERHGEEHLLLEDGLVCVCKNCHKKEHPNFSINRSERRRQRNQKKYYILSQLPDYPKKISEENISGSSFVFKRKLLEELEHERKIFIERNLYEGWKVHRI